MKLILLRHAKAQKARWDVPDRHRPLQERGHRQIIHLAPYLPGPLAVDPAVSWTIYCSPPLRTCQLLVLQSPSKNESGVHWRVEQSWIADQEDPW